MDRPAKTTGGREKLQMMPQSEGPRWDLHVPIPGRPVLEAAPDVAGVRRSYTYAASGAPADGSPVVQCAHWETTNEGERTAVLEAAMACMRKSGYVVLERLVPEELVLEAGEEFRRYKSKMPHGVTFNRMRASRDMTIPPFEGLWTDDRLVRHPLVLALIARYLRNSTDVSDEKVTEMCFAQWVTAGCQIDEFLTGPTSAGFPVMDLLVVVDTPSGAPAQSRHRDTILPGPCASIGVHIPLTPLQVSPLNGSIGFAPGTHTLAGLNAVPECEVVGAVPPGSVILYDSFTEHRGLENTSGAPRSALFAWYRVPGTYSGHTQENFGEMGLRTTDRFREYVGERLRQADAAEHVKFPSGASLDAKERWGFHRDSPLVPWGEEKVCFSCNRTCPIGGSGGPPKQPSAKGAGRSEWYCSKCWADSQRLGTTSPEPAPANVLPPIEFEGRVSEARLLELERNGLNIKPGKGRHKLTQLRERGLFLPVDPSSDWLARFSNDPQPSGWRDAIRKALGEIPRFDGF